MYFKMRTLLWCASHGSQWAGLELHYDIKCADASNEFGDDAGEGPGIGQEGYVAPNVVAGAVDGVIKFFKGLFSYVWKRPWESY